MVFGFSSRSGGGGQVVGKGFRAAAFDLGPSARGIMHGA